MSISTGAVHLAALAQLERTRHRKDQGKIVAPKPGGGGGWGGLGGWPWRKEVQFAGLLPDDSPSICLCKSGSVSSDTVSV